jgi:hypothetical protein
MTEMWRVMTWFVRDEVTADMMFRIIYEAPQGLAVSAFVPNDRLAHHGELVIDDFSIPRLGSVGATFFTDSFCEVKKAHIKTVLMAPEVPVHDELGDDIWKRYPGPAPARVIFTAIHGPAVKMKLVTGTKYPNVMFPGVQLDAVEAIAQARDILL